MKPNDRITYSNQIIGISEPNVSGTKATSPRGPRLHVLHGVQSVDINTKFNTQKVMEFGQSDPYEITEDIAEIELTVTKVLDGYPLIYTTATCSILDSGFLSLGLPNSRTSDTLLSRLNNECGVHLGIFSEYDDTINEKNAITQSYMSGMKVSNIQYSLNNSEPATETVTFLGLHKEWDSGNIPVLIDSGNTHGFQYWKERLPDEPGGSKLKTGGVTRRENFDMKESIIPASIIKTFNPSLNMLNTIPEKGNGQNSGIHNIHINSISINVSPSYEDLLELGNRLPFAKKLITPVNISCEIEILANSGDFVNVLSRGSRELAASSRTSGNNTTYETINIALNNGYVFNLGNKNKLTSVNYTGSVNGGNSTIIFAYENFNVFTISDLASGTLIDDIAPYLRLEYKQNVNFYDSSNIQPKKAIVLFDFSEPSYFTIDKTRLTIEGGLGNRVPLNISKTESEAPSKFVYTFDEPYTFFEGTGILDVSGVLDTASGYIMSDGTTQRPNYFNNNTPLSSSVYLDFCEPLRTLMTGVKLIAISGDSIDPKYSHYTSKAHYILPRSQPNVDFDILFHEPVFFAGTSDILNFDANYTLRRVDENLYNCAFSVPANTSGIFKINVKPNSFRDKYYNYNRPGITFKREKIFGPKNELLQQDFTQLGILFDRTLASGSFGALSVPAPSSVIGGVFNFNKPMDVSVTGVIVSNNTKISISNVRFNESDNKQIFFDIMGNYSGSGNISYNLEITSGTFTDIFGNKNSQIVSSGINNQ